MGRIAWGTLLAAASVVVAVVLAFKDAPEASSLHFRRPTRIPAPQGTDSNEDGVPTVDEPEPAPKLPRWVAPTTVSRLATTRGWMACLEVLNGLPPIADEDKAFARLTGALALARNPVCRQNLIFLVALRYPLSKSKPWLDALAAGPDPEDAEDAVVALAFSGDPHGRSGFALLARSPAPVNARRLLDGGGDLERLGEEGTVDARRLLRSYHAIEVYGRKPYFKITAFRVHGDLGWLPHPCPGPHLERELLTEWLARYPGHPGGDDMAWRIARTCRVPLQAARWYARGASLPDQKMLRANLIGLIRTTELLCTPEDLDLLAHDQGIDTPNRELLQYIRLRKLAAERGFAQALDEASAIAAAEFTSKIGVAWDLRWSVAPPKGVESGIQPLRASDPLLRRETVSAEAHGRREIGVHRIGYWTSRDLSNKQRLHPAPEAIQMKAGDLASQFRVWETLGELGRRAAGAVGAARADLLYKEAAVYYHQPRALFPVYAWQNEDFNQILLGPRPIEDETPEHARARLRFERESYAALRAIRLFDEIESESPGYAGMDAVYYSRALARRALLDYPPFRGYDAPAPYGGSDGRRARAIRGIVADFEHLTALYPQSDLAAPAARAARYWRGASSSIFESR